MTNLDPVQIITIVFAVIAASGITGSAVWLRFKSKIHDIRNIADDIDNIVQSGQPPTMAELKDIAANLQDLVS